MQNTRNYPYAIITSRPEGMSLENYREALRSQKRNIKAYLPNSRSLDFGIAQMMNSAKVKMDNASFQRMNAKRPKPTNITPKKPNRN